MADETSEPDAARARMADDLRSSGRLSSPAVEEAFRAVPRHVFLPELAAADAYVDQAFVIKTADSGMPLSSSSQPTMMAIMLEQLGIEPGDRVLEIGAGTGYNAAVMARLAGERGLVVTVDIDPGLVARARANIAAARAAAASTAAARAAAASTAAARAAAASTTAAGAGGADVVAVCGDGGFGAPDYAPYDKVIVTAAAWDIAPQWLAEIGPGGRIVLPLSVRGTQLSVALERADGHWRSRSVCPCGFIRMTGAFGSPESFVPVGPQPGLHVLTDDSRPLDTGALYAALTGPGTDVPTGVRVTGLSQLFEADLWATLTQPGLVLMISGGAPLRHAVIDDELPFGAVADSGSSFGVAGLRPAGLAGPSDAAETPAGPRKGRGRPLKEFMHSEFEVAVRGFGPGGPGLAGHLAARVAAWQQAGRPGAADLTVTVYPPGTAVPEAAAQVIVDRRHARLVLSWPPAAS